MQHLSASQFSRFLDCRYQYSLWKAQTAEEREASATPAMLRGRTIHDALANFYRLPPAQRQPLSDLPDDPEGTRMVGQFNKTFGLDPSQQPSYVEITLAAPLLRDVELVGILDTLTIRPEDKTLSIGEHKTHSRKPNLRNNAHFSLQPVVYQWLVQQAYPKFTLLDITYTGLWPSGAARYTRNLFELGKWAALLPVLANEMLSDPVPYPSYGLHCSWCAFQSVCLGEMGGVVDEAEVTDE